MAGLLIFSFAVLAVAVVAVRRRRLSMWQLVTLELVTITVTSSYWNLGLTRFAGPLELLLELLSFIAFMIGRAAERKGRSFGAWLALGFLFPWLAALIVAVMQPADGSPAADSVRAKAGFKICPRCAEPVRTAAVVCRYCQSSLVPAQQPAA